MKNIKSTEQIMSEFLKERNRKLHEMRLLLAGYMQNEDAARAKAVFEKWLKAVKEVGNEQIYS